MATDNIEHTSAASQHYDIDHSGAHLGYPEQMPDWATWSPYEYSAGPDPSTVTASQSAPFSDTDSIHSPMIDPALSHPEGLSYPASEAHQHSTIPASDVDPPPSAQGHPLLPQLLGPLVQAESSPQSQQSSPVVIHQFQDSKQRQERDLAHVLATKCDTKPAGETTEQTIRRVLNDLKKHSGVQYHEGSTTVLRSPAPCRSNTASSDESMRGVRGNEGASPPYHNQTSATSKTSSPGETSPQAQINGVQCRMCSKVLPRNCDRK